MFSTATSPTLLIFMILAYGSFTMGGDPQPESSSKNKAMKPAYVPIDSDVQQPPFSGRWYRFTCQNHQSIKAMVGLQQRTINYVMRLPASGDMKTQWLERFRKIGKFLPPEVDYFHRDFHTGQIGKNDFQHFKEVFVGEKEDPNQNEDEFEFENLFEDEDEDKYEFENDIDGDIEGNNIKKIIYKMRKHKQKLREKLREKQIERQIEKQREKYRNTVDGQIFFPENYLKEEYGTRLFSPTYLLERDGMEEEYGPGSEPQLSGVERAIFLPTIKISAERMRAVKSRCKKFRDLRRLLDGRKPGLTLNWNHINLHESIMKTTGLCVVQENCDLKEIPASNGFWYSGDYLYE